LLAFCVVYWIHHADHGVSGGSVSESRSAIICRREVVTERFDVKREVPPWRRNNRRG
jgi:hypothetical protein